MIDIPVTADISKRRARAGEGGGPSLGLSSFLTVSTFARGRGIRLDRA